MRKGVDRLFRALTGICAGIVVALLGAIALTLIFRGLPALSWEFVSRPAGVHFGSGGVVYQLLGTVVLIGTALLVSVPLATSAALLEAVYLKGRARRLMRVALYAVNGVPSIVFGIFGLLLFVQIFGWGKSWLAGGIILGLMILPTLAVSLAERIEALPPRYLRAAAGLGMSHSQVVWAVILPQSRGGLLSGALLGLARAAGETAPIMFTAVVFAGATIPHGVRENPVLALPYHIFVLAQDSFDPGVQAQLWGTAVVLLSLVFALSVLTLPIRLRNPEQAHHG